MATRRRLCFDLLMLVYFDRVAHTIPGVLRLYNTFDFLLPVDDTFPGFTNDERFCSIHQLGLTGFDRRLVSVCPFGSNNLPI